MGTPEWRRLLEGVMFKDEFNRIMTGQSISGGSTRTSSGSPPLLSGYLKADGTVPLTRDWDAGGYKITAKELSTDTISEELSGSGVTVDGVLIKDNHLVALRALGMSLKDIVTKAKQNAPRGLTVEVEVNTTQEAIDAVEGGADIIMLDPVAGKNLKPAVIHLNRKGYF